MLGVQPLQENSQYLKVCVVSLGVTGITIFIIAKVLGKRKAFRNCYCFCGVAVLGRQVKERVEEEKALAYSKAFSSGGQGKRAGGLEALKLCRLYKTDGKELGDQVRFCDTFLLCQLFQFLVLLFCNLRGNCPRLYYSFFDFRAHFSSYVFLFIIP